MKTQKRESNLELMRIVAMFFIVLHHYVVNSGIMEIFSPGSGEPNFVFLKLIGAYGKTAINPFVITSGFFMCTSTLTPRRFCKILFEWLFYAWVIYVVFLLSNYEKASPARLIAVAFPFFSGVNRGFTSSFVWFYLGIPIYNLVIKGLSKKGLYMLTGILLLMFVVPITFFRN